MLKKVGLSLSFAVLAACADQNVSNAMSAVTPITSRETVIVSAEDLVVSMVRTGFSREEILEYGPKIRNALAVSGGAEVRRNGEVTAIFSAMDNSLYVVSQRGGTYVHPLGP